MINNSNPKALNEAFAVLRDPKLRSLYDSGGEMAVTEYKQRQEKVEQQLEVSRMNVELPSLSVLMHRIGRGVEWEEILAAIRFNDPELPRVINQSNIRFHFTESFKLLCKFSLD